MTAGSVAVPTIIPLKAPQGSKYTIDSNTRIEIRSGMRYPNVPAHELQI